ncbi:Chondroitin polymerase [Ruminococcus bromii]|nr:glycosyltransferase family A protein [Ruminococcus bromii]PKD29623.1 Chondroitin polymerase [Ruminococcus bromii]
MAEKTLTVFTPTFNRRELLTRCYESMCRQTNKDFVWMIVDDGSTDDTKKFADEWKKNSDLEIRYIYKDNGGLHTAYNVAIENIDTELCVCIDSDDFMPDNAVELILNFWDKYGSDEYAGIVGLDFNLDGKVIGDPLPNQKTVNLIDLFIGKYDIVNGDRTNVIRTELYKTVAPMKVFPNEKNFNPHYMHLQISDNYDFLVLNENLRFVDYQSDGMTNSMLKQYKSSPNSFAEIRKLYLSFSGTPLKFKIKHSIHLVSSCILAHKLSFAFDESPYPIISALVLPLGVALSVFVRYKG